MKGKRLRSARISRAQFYVLCFLIPVITIVEMSLLADSSGVLTGRDRGQTRATNDTSQSQEVARTERATTIDESLQRARELLKSGSVSEAERLVRVCLEKEPDSSKGHFLLGLVLFRQGRAKESLAEYMEGAKHHNPNAEDLKIVALNYVLLGSFTEADKWLTQSIAWNPNDAEAWYHLGRTKYNESRFEEAIGAFQHCLKLDARNVKAESNMGLSLAALGRLAEAQSAYREAISWQAERAVKIAEPYIDLGNFLLDQNQTDEAVVYLLQANAVLPEDPRLPEALGKAYWRQNRLEDARLEFEKAVRLVPTSSANHYLLGQIYRKQGMVEKAKVELDRAAELIASHALPANLNH
jgi:tetratricopeptide (TPR) repeat protein